MERLLVVSRSNVFVETLSGCPQVAGKAILPVGDVAAARSILADTPVRAVIVDLATVAADAASTLAGHCKASLILLPAGVAICQEVEAAFGLRPTPDADTPASGPAHGVVRIGPLTVDRLQWRVELDHQEVPLSSREFRLVDFLTRHQNQVMTREAIISKVWGPAFDGTDRVVDVCLSRLRRQLFDRPGCPVTVRAIPGVGYKLQAKGGSILPVPMPNRFLSTVLTAVEA
jgi:DNA-binding winged helix-turn-helix (wHTH) protein